MSFTENGDCTGISRMSRTRSPITDTLSAIASRSLAGRLGAVRTLRQFHVASVRPYPIGRTTVPHQRPFSCPATASRGLCARHTATFAADFSKRHDA